MAKTIRIGGASGFWGDADVATPQLLSAGCDYVVYDYLAEITLSIMARARAKDPALGYATDFVAALTPQLEKIVETGVKIVSNAGGLNPVACADALRTAAAKAGLRLKISVVTGDDLTPRSADFKDVSEMFSGAPFPPQDRIASVNAYLGAFPIAEALKQGADIVITGRCVDSAVAVAPCIHEFGWEADDVHRLAAASLAGHILECGAQATGGNFTDWEDISDPAYIGYPIAEIEENGDFTISKPEGTGGKVTVGTVGEQMLYEIGDPRAYILPDVICDFSDVSVEAAGQDLVRVSGARGRGAPADYKVSATYSDGWRIAFLAFFVGEQAAAKANVYAEAALTRAEAKLEAMGAPGYEEVAVELLGDESHYGVYAREFEAREVTLKIAVKHADARACSLLLKEATGLGLSAPPGLTLFGGYRPKPSPVVRLFSYILPKADVDIDIDGRRYSAPEHPPEMPAGPAPEPETPETPPGEQMTEVPLNQLAYLRSGDKGDKANIGVFPRNPKLAPWLWAGLPEHVVAARFAHFLEGEVERFFLPGTGSINFLLHDVLGGGGMASLRNDPQGKTYGQILGQTPIVLPRKLAETL